ncbi:MAG: hypothetical protein J6C93_05935 [Clostridia bacterium]|nr:hypothetical protein [Clostridia bacterium]
MNLKNVGSVALSLVAVACIALGVGYNASTLGSDGAKVDAAQEPPSTNATAQPETPPAQEAASSETTSAEPQKPQQDDETKFQWSWKTISFLSLGAWLLVDFITAFYSQLRDRAVIGIIGFLMKFGPSIVSFLNPARANSQSLKIEQLSDAALELFLAALERHAVRITATANDFVLVRDGDSSTDFSPRNLKDEPSRVLAELETVRLVAQESKGIFKVEEQDKEILKALSDEIDLRVYREILADNSLREFFERVQTPDALLTIKFGIAPKLHGIIAERPENRRPILQFPLPLGEVLKIGVFLQNAKLIEGWYESFPGTNQRMICKLPQVDPDAPGIRFVEELLELDQLPQQLTGAFSERGKIICRMFQK